MADETYEGLTIPEYDAREQAARLEREKDDRHDERLMREQRHRLRIQRLQTGGAVVGFISAAAAAVGVAYVLWLGFRGPSTEDQQRQEARLACIDKGGVWLDVAEGTNNTDSTFGTCAFGLGR